MGALRASKSGHSLVLAKSHNNNANAYRFIKGKEQRFLNDEITAQATLCRAFRNQPKIRLSEPADIPQGACIEFGNCTATVSQVADKTLTLADVSGCLPGAGIVRYKSHAYTMPTMSREFQAYWSQFWMRDSYESRHSDVEWQPLIDDLEETIPAQPMLTVVFDNPKFLKESIRRLKSHKAVGVDGWHAEELQCLTDTMLQDFTTLLTRVWHIGLSTQLMRARTLLFAKRDHPTSISDGRPITILGYMVRITSKLISDQILAQWAAHWPPVISGGLPRRSARDLCILQQLQIEHAKTSHTTAWGGWTMDLVKALNLIPRRIIRHILELLGVPSYITNFWFLSLARLTRVLQSGRNLSDPYSSTTGLPEGDSMSVVGMLALSFVFHAKLQSPRVFPYAYADNWSFMSTSERHCFQAMTTLFNLVSDLKMQIDFRKSWCWATTKQFRTFWESASALLLDPTFQFVIKSHVHDLGCTISYTNAVVLGPHRDKIDNAIAKCNRLRKLQLSLEERAEKIQTAIWPAVFYGALGLTIGDKHFTTLRRAATNVLVGDHKYASSMIALHYLTERVQDPLLYIVTDMLTTLRRLYVYYPDAAQSILHTLRTFDGKVRGPASALASYLNKLGWEVSSNATLLGPGGLRVSLSGSSSKQIKAQVRIAWDWHCHKEVYHRKGVPQNPFDSLTTIRLMQTLTDRQRRILALSLTSGWQSLGAIANWSATQDPHCPWCGQFDTHTHQLLDCPEFATTRAEHAEAITYISNNHYACWFPLPYHHQNTELVRQAMHLRDQTCTIHTPHHIPNHTVVYRDGTCDNPRDPYAARAAWAAIIRTPTDPTHETETINWNFQVLAAGHCPGHQTIGRAELYAMVVAVELISTDDSASNIQFVTDSQYVVNCINQIEDETIFTSPHKKSTLGLNPKINLDLATG